MIGSWLTWIICFLDLKMKTLNLGNFSERTPESIKKKPPRN